MLIINLIIEQKDKTLCWTATPPKAIYKSKFINIYELSF